MLCFMWTENQLTKCGACLSSDPCHKHFPLAGLFHNEKELCVHESNAVCRFVGKTSFACTLIDL